MVFENSGELVAFHQGLVAPKVRLVHPIPSHDPSYLPYESLHYFALIQIFWSYIEWNNSITGISQHI